MINLWPLLLPAAAISGWYVANRQYHRKEEKADRKLSREYVQGLNYLLNEQPDKAVDLFIKLLDVDSDTVETHLALASLFRRRGEVDRAIRIHQNLIARPQLSLTERKESLLALGQDYLSAGLFDRAERIFLELIDLGGEVDKSSLYGLIAIYQQEQDWEQALQVAKKIEHCTGGSTRTNQAHYYCEMAEKAIKAKQLDKAEQLLKTAIQVDKNSVRASLMLAELDKQAGRPKQAVKILRSIIEQDPDFLSEVIPHLVDVYQQLGDMGACVQFLLSTIQKHPRASTIFVVAEHIRSTQGIDAAIEFLSERLREYPSIRGLNRLIEWHLEYTQGKVRQKLEILHDITSKFLNDKPVYRCGHCGYAGRHLHWHCPKCKQWGQMKPVHGLEGD